MQDTLNVTVTGTVTPHEDGTYSYSYAVRNESTSTDTIDSFAISPVPKGPIAISPEHWWVFYGFADDSSALVWVPKELGAAPPGWIDDSVSVHVSEYAIEPGQTLNGFSFRSRCPPDTVDFLIKPWRDIPDVSEEVEEPNGYWGEDSARGRIVGPGLPGIR
jgi:hypothetical protein